MLVSGKCECFAMQMYVCVLCAYCGSYQCCVLHDLQEATKSRTIDANQPSFQNIGGSLARNEVKLHVIS